MTKRIIAICSTTGPGSGKSTYLETVVRQQFPDAEHLRFSDPIVSFLCDGLHCLHGKGREDYEALKKAELLPGITGRDFMIAAGDTLRKALDPAFYALILKRRIASSKADTIIIDDLRKVPELAMLVDSPWSVLIVNVMKPQGGESDCEFLWTSPYLNAKRSKGTMRYMEVTWDGKGSFVRSDRSAAT